MAAVGPKLTIPFTVGTSKIVGQGDHPEPWILYTTDDATDTDPSWVDATVKMRAFQTSRGRGSELDEVDTGTCEISLDNRERNFDPVTNTGIRPMNRWWIREQFTGETQDLFKGYADSYDQQWPGGGGRDALTVVRCSDEFKRLARMRLPTMNPPRDTYMDLVMSDKPDAYWRMNNASEELQETAAVGPTLYAASGMTTVVGTGGIVGDNPDPYMWLRLNPGSSEFLTTRDLQEGQTPDMGGLAEMTVEFWFQCLNYPASGTHLLMAGPTVAGGALRQWWLELGDGGTITLSVRNNTPATVSVSTDTIPTLSPLGEPSWHHIVGTANGVVLQIWVDGQLADTTSWSGTIQANAGITDSSDFFVGTPAGSATSNYLDFDELAVYRVGFPSGRVAAHYQAGSARGFARGQWPGTRANAVLDAAGSQAPRRIGTGTTTILMSGSFMQGQDPLSKLRESVKAEAPDGLLFTSKDGTIVLLDSTHRTVSPYNTVQATFDDDGTDLPYRELDIDYSESFLVNDWNVTRSLDGLTQTASDATSISRYGQMPQSLTDVPVTDDADAATIAAALLAKYKDPMTRIIGLQLTTANAAVAEALFRLDIGDRIRVLSTPPGGGTRIDQTVFVQKIEISASRTSPVFNARLGVSPL